MGETQKKRRKVRGWIFFTLWFVLIWSGIFNKRLLGHPDQMVLFHLPAAVFLVLSAYELSYEFRKRNRAAVERYRAAMTVVRPDTQRFTEPINLERQSRG